MTREEAVEFLIVTQNISPEHMMELLGALSPQVCDDCVSREAVMDAITAEYNRKSTGDGLRIAWIEKAVNSVPSVSPQQKVGKWELVRYDGLIGNWHCSECRTIIPHMPEETDNTPIYKWCPNCGAKMEVHE